MAEYDELLAWATSKGVRLNGITPKKIPGAGLGIVATRDIKTNEVVLAVPTKVLRTVDTVPRSISSKLPSNATVHSLLALDIALDPTSAYIVWKSVFPSFKTFQSCMPLLWPASTWSSLPLAARKLVEGQRQKLSKDWAVISSTSAFKDLDYEKYAHAWLLVSTRTFYYATAKHEKTIDKDNRMAMQPVADLFNHTPRGCHVRFHSRPPAADGVGFAITADRAYKAGEEVTISYGSHSNDVLLAEYGFVMDKNEWDEVMIDELVLPRLSRRQRERLAEWRFEGGYVVDGRTPVCYRTEVAVRALLLDEKRWMRFVRGEDDGEGSQYEVDELLLGLLEGWRVVEGIGDDGGGEVEAYVEELLGKRWGQIRDMVAKTRVLLGERLRGEEKVNRSKGRGRERKGKKSE